MVDYLAHFESTLAALKDERRYRVLDVPIAARHT